MRLQTVLIATIACTSLTSCAISRSPDTAWAVGIWQPVETDYDVLSSELVEFTKDGTSFLYDRSCNRLKETEFVVRDGDIYVGSRDPDGRFPPAIFRPSENRTKLIHGMPGSELTTTYGKTSMSECHGQG